MKLLPLLAFQDNYLRVLHDGQRALVVQAILVTRHHPDHIGGLDELREATGAHGPEVGGRPLLFCGDALFSGDCGRLFEGTPAQMPASLDKLAATPRSARVCCTHEYTLSNLKFARVVEPHNAELINYSQRCEELRGQSLPTPVPAHAPSRRCPGRAHPRWRHPAG